MMQDKDQYVMMVGLITILKLYVENCIIVLQLYGVAVNDVIILLVFIQMMQFVEETNLILINVRIYHSHNTIVILIQNVYTYNVEMQHIKPFYYLQLILQESNITQEMDQYVMIVGLITILKLYVANCITVLQLRGDLVNDVIIIMVFIQMMQFVMETSLILINAPICLSDSTIVI